MSGVVEIDLFHFGLTYLLLVAVLFIMKRSEIDQTSLLLVGTVRMTVQLFVAGLIITYIFKDPKPIYTIAYLTVMTIFAMGRVLSRNRDVNRNFKVVIALSILVCTMAIIVFYTEFVVEMSILNPQYAIPISGMLYGNVINGVTLGLKSFKDSVYANRNRIETLLNLGSSPQRVILPFVNNATETALLPNLNSMVSMGIVTLPGMMTGQILSGVSPLTSILYQITIAIALCAASCLSVYCTLNFGYKTLFNDRNQLLIFQEEGRKDPSA